MTENPYSFLQASAQLRETYKAMRKLAIMRAQTQEFYAAFDQIALRLGNVEQELKEEVRAELAELVVRDIENSAQTS